MAVLPGHAGPLNQLRASLGRTVQAAAVERVGQEVGQEQRADEVGQHVGVHAHQHLLAARFSHRAARPQTERPDVHTRRLLHTRLRVKPHAPKPKLDRGCSRLPDLQARAHTHHACKLPRASLRRRTVGRRPRTGGPALGRRALRKMSSGSGARSTASHAPLHARRCSAALAQRMPLAARAACAPAGAALGSASAPSSCRRRLRRRRAPSPASAAAAAVPASAAPHQDANGGASPSSAALGSGGGWASAPPPPAPAGAGGVGGMAVSTSNKLRARSAPDTCGASHRAGLAQARDGPVRPAYGQRLVNLRALKVLHKS